MYQTHPNEERDETCEGETILHEQLLGPNIPPADTKDDDDRGETSTPPADEESRLIIAKGAHGWRVGVDGHIGVIEKDRGHARLPP